MLIWRQLCLVIIRLINTLKHIARSPRSLLLVSCFLPALHSVLYIYHPPIPRPSPPPPSTHFLLLLLNYTTTILHTADNIGTVSLSFFLEYIHTVFPVKAIPYNLPITSLLPYSASDSDSIYYIYNTITLIAKINYCMHIALGHLCLLIIYHCHNTYHRL